MCSVEMMEDFHWERKDIGILSEKVFPRKQAWSAKRGGAVIFYEFKETENKII